MQAILKRLRYAFLHIENALEIIGMPTALIYSYLV